LNKSTEDFEGGDLKLPAGNGNKRFLITGGAGFIGSHLAELLLDNGCSVSVLDDLSTGALTNIQPLLANPRFHFARADVNNEVVLDRLASEAHTIIHLAAAVGVQLIVQRPVHTILNNIRGAEAVLNAALRYGCLTFIASTSEVFGKSVKVPFNEDDDVLLGASNKSRWSYAVSKLVDECLAFAYHREHGLPVILARLFNTVGARQRGYYGMVIPRMMRQAISGMPITVFGDGSQRRCFCDVRDVVSAIYLLIQSPSAVGHLFSIGSQEEISMLDLANRIKFVTGSSSDIVRIPYDQAYGPGFEDMERRVPDTAKIEAYTGWSRSLELEETLYSVRDWCISNAEPEAGISLTNR
jgi:UDP-glucose 4-epimerase